MEVARGRGACGRIQEKIFIFRTLLKLVIPQGVAKHNPETELPSVPQARYAPSTDHPQAAG